MAPMAGELCFFVPGLPAPKGSLRAIKGRSGSVFMKESSDRARPWMASVALAARDAGASAEDGPVRLSAHFFFPRPKAHFKSDGSIKPSAPGYPTGKPDLDKLLRAVLDALANVAFADDSRVVEIGVARKDFAPPKTPVGARIWVQKVGGIPL